MMLRRIALSAAIVLPITLQSIAASPAVAGSSYWGWGSGMMGGGGGMMGQGWGGQGWGMMGPSMMGGGCGMMGSTNGADFQTYTEGRIAFLQAELKITDAQKSAWNSYADALRSNSEVMASMHQQMLSQFQKKGENSLQWLDFHIRMMKSHLAAMEVLKPATEALYKILSVAQQQKADQLLPAMGCI